jgi:mannose-1-phosphate guanylyltransferase
MRRARRPAPRHLLFRESLDRATHLIPEDRLVAVLARGHSAQYDSALEGLPSVRRVVQPAYRGSAAELFLPVMKIARQDPDAIVVVLPSDHLVDTDARLMKHVDRAARAAIVRPDLPVVIGAHPSSPVSGAGWIEPGLPVEGLEPYAVRSVRRFHTHPSSDDVAALFASDGLINTHVVIARVAALIGLGRRAVPDILEALEPLEAAYSEPEEALMSEAVYEQMPYANLSHVLFARPHGIAVLAADVHVRHDVTPGLLALVS